MSTELLNRAAFGVFEILSYLIPGILIVATLAVFYPSENILQQGLSFSEAILVLLVVFLAFTAGVAVQSASFLIEKPVLKLGKWGRPSVYLLDPANKKFPSDFKRALRQLAEDLLKVPKDADSQHFFSVCYTYIMQEGLGGRVTRFLYMYSFCRNMMATMLVEMGLLVAPLVSAPLQLVTLEIVLIGLAILFLKQYLRYSEDFAKEALLAFYVHAITLTKTGTET